MAGDHAPDVIQELSDKYGVKGQLWYHKKEATSTEIAYILLGTKGADGMASGAPLFPTTIYHLQPTIHAGLIPRAGATHACFGSK